jgi:hypothetical protein
MGYLKNKSVLMDQNRTIEPAGTRCRLYAVQVGIYSTAVNHIYSDITEGNLSSGRNVTLRTGSVSGSILFDVQIGLVTTGGYYIGELPIVYNLDPNYVLFEDGMFMMEISNVSDDLTADKLNKSKVQLSLFYELG